MSPRQFDRVMVAMHIGSHPKFARLNNNELLCFVTGILPVAQQSLFRGTLTVGDQPATPEDISAQTGRRASPAVVRSTIKKLRDVGALFEDDEIGALRVHDFEDWNPAPKVDRTNAERQRRFRERHAPRNGVTDGERNAVTNGAVTPPEVEETKTTPPSPPGGEGETGQAKVTYLRRTVPDDVLALAVDLLAEFDRRAGTSHKPYDDLGRPSESLRLIIGAVLSHGEEITTETGPRLVAVVLAEPWWSGKPSVGVVFGPKVLERNLQRLAGAGQQHGRVDLAARRRALGYDDEVSA